ncbi:LPXTG cell wall anchor domain-containing protein [Saccharomonospora sp.]|uniref:LPXTG cell wall anchor domain-containing protein n=1 Tax=Saccharomonospora sp. TaxID=33913 RepID=UPI002618ABA8|nr:LPXTG cell wall anchor domain-containing protein [Saccharomonospora sp.]
MTVGLRDVDDADAPMVTAVTDEQGRAVFTDQQAGLYHIEIFGPWQREEGAAAFARVHATYGEHHNTTTVGIVPGPDRPLPGEDGDSAGDSLVGVSLEDPSANPPAGSQNRADDVDTLASTGTDAVTLVGVGAAVLLVGAATVVITRRRGNSSTA